MDFVLLQTKIHVHIRLNLIEFSVTENILILALSSLLD